MSTSLTLDGRLGRRSLSLVFGLGMAVASLMTIRHFFLANYPDSLYKGAFCDISAFFNCDSSAFSALSQIGGVPLGYFGLVAGLLVSLGAVFPSAAFERTNKSIALVNALGVLALAGYSVFYLGSLCLLCSGYYVFSLLSFFLFWRSGIDQDERGFLARYVRPSFKHLMVFGIITGAGAYGLTVFHEAKQQAQSGGVAAKVVKEYYSLPTVQTPSFVSPYWTMKATDRFEDAPIHIVEYVDFRCPDCLYLNQQLDRLKEEFKGKMNIAIQFFPLEAKCNTVVEKDLHPGACDLSYIAAYDPARFVQIHDEIFGSFQEGKKPEWRAALARKYGADAALTDQKTKDVVARIIRTGAEYEKTSDKFSHGIRSTPTMIVNNRMIIGTLPYAQLRAIFQSLVEVQGGPKKFIENWVPRK